MYESEAESMEECARAARRWLASGRAALKRRQEAYALLFNLRTSRKNNKSFKRANYRGPKKQ